jgi:hypothetical protein
VAGKKSAKALKGDSMASKPEIKEFGKILMQHVRDETIRTCDRLMTPQCQLPVAERWRKAAQSGSPELLLREAIPDIVNDTLSQLLYAIDEGWLKLSYTAENGNVVMLTNGDTGELSGWMGGGPEGWLTQYSKERWVDDAPDFEKRLNFTTIPSKRNL